MNLTFFDEYSTKKEAKWAFYNCQSSQSKKVVKNRIYLGSSLGLGLGSFDLEFLELLDEVFGTEVDDVEEVLEVEVVALFPAYLFSLGSSWMRLILSFDISSE